MDEAGSGLVVPGHLNDTGRAGLLCDAGRGRAGSDFGELRCRRLWLVKHVTLKDGYLRGAVDTTEAPISEQQSSEAAQRYLS